MWCYLPLDDELVGLKDIQSNNFVLKMIWGMSTANGWHGIVSSWEREDFVEVLWFAAGMLSFSNSRQINGFWSSYVVHQQNHKLPARLAVLTNEMVIIGNGSNLH